MSALKVFAGIWLAIGCVLMVVLLWWLSVVDAWDEAFGPVLTIVAITAAGVSVPWIVGLVRRRE